MQIVLTKRRECNSIKLDIHFKEKITEEQINQLCEKLSAKCRNFGDLLFIEFSGGRITASTTARHLTLRCDSEKIQNVVTTYLQKL